MLEVRFTPVPLSGACISARKWIEQGNVKAVEVDHVAGHHRELMDLGDGGDHRVFVERVRFAASPRCDDPAGGERQNVLISTLSFLLLLLPALDP